MPSQRPLPDNVDEPVPTSPADVRAAGSAALDDPAIMASQMAAGAERERLERRVAELEAENTALRRTLAEMVKLGVDGLGPEPALARASVRRRGRTA